MREDCALFSFVLLASYDNPVVAFFCLTILILLFKPFIFNNNEDDDV